MQSETRLFPGEETKERGLLQGSCTVEGRDYKFVAAEGLKIARIELVGRK